MEPLQDNFEERYAQNRAGYAMGQVEALAKAHLPYTRQASLLEVREKESFAERAAILEARSDVAARINYLSNQLIAANARLTELLNENAALKGNRTAQKAHTHRFRLFQPIETLEDKLWYATV